MAQPSNRNDYLSSKSALWASFTKRNPPYSPPIKASSTNKRAADIQLSSNVPASTKAKQVSVKVPQSSTKSANDAHYGYLFSMSDLWKRNQQVDKNLENSTRLVWDGKTMTVDQLWEQGLGLTRLAPIEPDVDWNKMYAPPKTLSSTIKVVFVRHGESIWNKSGKFTGWVDIPLNQTGREQAREAGRQLRAQGYHFDVAYTSMLDRAVETTDLILDEMGLKKTCHVHKSWRINERHYGQLQGLDKKATAQQYGQDQVQKWRQSYNNPPPQIDYDSEEHPRFDPMYKHMSAEEHAAMPKGESLELVRQRVEPYWREQILPTLQHMKGGSSVLISAHEHVLRGLTQYLAGLDNEQILSLRLPNGAPFVFEFQPKQEGLFGPMKKEFEAGKNYYIDNEQTTVFERAMADDAKIH